MSNPSGNTNPPPEHSNWLPKLLVGFLLGLVVMYIYSSSTLVKGLEFNPGTWQMRSYQFRSDPFTGYQWTGIQHGSAALKADKAIIAMLDSQARRDSSRWDLAEISQLWEDQSGPSVIMLQLLTGYRSARGFRSVEFWVQWTTDHPNRAKKFWPSVQKLAILGAYAQIPDLLEIPLLEADDDRFSQLLDQQMLKTVKKCIALFLSQGNQQSAVLAAQLGLEYAPNDPEFIDIAVSSTSGDTEN